MPTFTFAFTTGHLAIIQNAYNEAVLDSTKWADVYSAIFEIVTDPETGAPRR